MPHQTRTAAHRPPEEAHAKQLLAALHAVYKRRKQLTAFKEEGPIYALLLPRLIRDLRHTYSIVRPLPVLGSTATVWELRDTKIGQKRALKLPRPRLSRLTDIIRVIRAEAKRLAALNHQNIVKIYSVGELALTRGKAKYLFPYFIMEFLKGVQDLGDYIDDHSHTCSGETLIGYFRDILDGLSYLHANGIVHCDIKPGNILIPPGGRPALITDFGYAKAFPRSGDPSKRTDVTFTLDYAHPQLRDSIVGELWHPI